MTGGTIPQSAEPTAPFTQRSQEHQTRIAKIKRFQNEVREVEKEDGSADYADGFYEASKNRIVVNPEGKRTAEKLLIHELDHAIRKHVDKTGKQSTRIYLDAIEGVDQATRDKILGAYKKTAKPGQVAAVVMDETNAYYAEQVLGNKYTLEKLLEAEPTLKDKILSFFKGASTDYADVPKLSNAAKKYYKTYKKLFDEFSARNYENNAIEKPLSSMKTENMHDSGKQYTFKGVAEDGIRKYESNFPKGTPKSAKSEKILDYITNVWSKKPIKLVISNGETSRTITAQFDPTLDPSGNEPTDASKIAGGNRHGSASEKRVTLDLADDYYQIASEAKYNYSKEEIGKDSKTHKDVMMWHYFVDDIYFSEHGKSNYTPYTVTVNVKEKTDGTFVYSFNAEKTEESSTRRTLHAGVNTRKGANGELFIDSIPQTEGKSNSFDKKTFDRQNARHYALDIDSDSENISGAEVMGWLNNKPKSDGKLDLEATVARGLPYKRGKSDLTFGEIRKVIANTTHEKVYSKSDALKAVNKLSGTWGLTVKARDEIADTVWQFLNEAPDVEYRQDMAHDIAEYIVAKVLMDSKTENPDALEDVPSSRGRNQEEKLILRSNFTLVN